MDYYTKRIYDGTLRLGTGVSLKLDYRWFFDDNTKFNKDLCKSSLLFAGMAYYRSTSDTSDSSDRDYKIQLDSGEKYGIMDTMKYMGLEDVEECNLNDYYNTEHLSQFNIGHRKVIINGKTKNIVTVFVRGTYGSLNEWTSNFDIGDTREKVSEWTDKSNHKGFDITANRILERINIYLNKYVDSSDETVFWITGHSRGAAISNIIGAKLQYQGKKTFTYTFASPNTTTKGNIKNYKSIFNVVNEDDFVPYLPMNDWKFGKYGRIAKIDMTSSMQKEFRDKTGFFAYNNESTKGLEKTVTALSEIMNDRNECKEYTCSCHGNGSDNSIVQTNYQYSYEGREQALSLFPDNATPYCRITKFIGNKGKLRSRN